MSQRPGGPDPRRWLALALLGTAFFMVIVDGTIVYVALPSIDAALGFSAGGLQWVMSAYLLTFGGLLLLGGRSADLLGRRRMFMAGVSLFAGSSLLCGLAWSDQVLVAARVVQGIAAAILAPTALSLLVTVFDEGPERNKALGIWGGIGGVGATSGLLIGGPVTQGLGWEWVFFINVPVGLGVLALCPALLPESREPVGRHVYDVTGAVTITAALVLLVYAVSEAPDVGWTGVQTIALVVASLALIAAFVRIEARSGAPLVPLRIFRSRTLVGGNLVLLTAGAALDGMLIIVTLYAQQVLGYSTVQFGLGVAVMTVMSVLGAVSGQALVTRVGPRPVALTGMILVGAACLFLTQVSVDGSYFADVFPGLLLFGAGLGATFVASQIAGLSGVADEEAGLAAGLVDSSFNVGSALGIAVLSAVAVARTDDVLAGAGRPADPALALTEGFQAAFLAGVAIAALGALLTLLLRRRDTTEDARPKLPEWLRPVRRPARAGTGARARAPKLNDDDHPEGGDKMGLSAYKARTSTAVYDIARAGGILREEPGPRRKEEAGRRQPDLRVWRRRLASRICIFRSRWQPHRHFGDLVRRQPRAGGGRAQFPRRQVRALRRPSSGDRRERDPRARRCRVAWCKDPGGNTFPVEWEAKP
jgi:EmrB/QacA subfamily drug resistance transporter